MTELRPFEFLAAFCTIGYNVIISYFYSFCRILFILCKHVGNIMKIYIWLFKIDKINFDNYSHLNLVILSNSSHSRIQSW